MVGCLCLSEDLDLDNPPAGSWPRATPLSQLALDGKAKELQGIGKTIEEKIVQVVEDGYAIGERCLRPAKVGVSRGGPKGGEAPAA